MADSPQPYLSPASNGWPASKALREIAEWLDLYDSILNPMFEDLARRKGLEWEGPLGDGCQKDLRRWADEIEEDK